MSYFDTVMQVRKQAIEDQLRVMHFVDSLINDIRYRKFKGDPSVKPLEFLLEADRDSRTMWVYKALVTANHHNFVGSPSCPLEFFLKCKEQMKLDRQAGLKLW